MSITMFLIYRYLRIKKTQKNKNFFNYKREKISTKLLYYINYIQLNINLPLLRS